MRREVSTNFRQKNLIKNTSLWKYPNNDIEVRRKDHHVIKINKSINIHKNSSSAVEPWTNLEYLHKVLFIHFLARHNNSYRDPPSMAQGIVEWFSNTMDLLVFA